jgi:hypothetical protein
MKNTTMPCLSTASIMVALVFIVGLTGWFWLRGGLIFSPGPLSNHTEPGALLGGAESHASFEKNCSSCHHLLLSQHRLCLSCHDDIMAEMNDPNSMHIQMGVSDNCTGCHPDHRGRDFDPLTTAFDQFDHTMTGFSLFRHAVDYHAVPMKCSGCHPGDDFESDPATCQTCHAEQDPDFDARHSLEFGPNCLDCHDGLDSLARFNHNTTVFPLDGKHSEVRCAACHVGGVFGDTPATCQYCHEEPSVHQGIFGIDCQACHTPADWSPAFMDGQTFDHAAAGFSLIHHQQYPDGSALTCSDCHSNTITSFEMNTCITCHNDLDADFMQQHRDDFGDACLDCHDGTGEMSNFDHAQFFALDGAHGAVGCRECHTNAAFSDVPANCLGCHPEPEVHLGLFGTSCENCHTTAAWSPAQLQDHTFPLDHGESGVVECQVCHPAAYTTYTCYGCHEHTESNIISEHNEENISPARLTDCTECHPDGRED